MFGVGDTVGLFTALIAAALCDGGLDGLAASIALRNTGVTTQVFERAERFTEVGVAVGATPNGLTALDADGRGIGAAVRRRG